MLIVIEMFTIKWIKICEYSTMVSASACHAEDVSSILITRSRSVCPHQTLKVCGCCKFIVRNFVWPRYRVLRLVSVNCPSMSLRLSFDIIVKRAEPSNRWIREWMLYCAWTMWMYKGNSLLWADNGKHFCFARRESGFDSQLVHRNKPKLCK